jgi:ABC-type proline/glycine betaine transport system ATPase subunit
VFQGIGLFPHTTIGEHVCGVLRVLKWEKTKSNSDAISDVLQNLPKQQPE